VNQQPVDAALRGAIAQTLALVFAVDNAGLQVTTRCSPSFVNSIFLVGALTTAFAFWMMLRPVLLRTADSHGHARSRVRLLIDQYGQKIIDTVLPNDMLECKTKEGGVGLVRMCEL
jgi:phosphatidylglycerol lysyltransferase